MTEERTIQVAVEALPFWYAYADDRTLRMWVFREIHGLEMPLTQTTLNYMEDAVQWIKRGKKKTKPDLKVVK